MKNVGSLQLQSHPECYIWLTGVYEQVFKLKWRILAYIIIYYYSTTGKQNYLSAVIKGSVEKITKT